MTRCFTCRGSMIPAPYAGDPDLCLLCGRSNQAQPTYAEMIARTRAATLELAGLPPESSPRLGRPPGSTKARA